MPAILVEQGKLSMNRMGTTMMTAFGCLTVSAMLAGGAADRLISRGLDAVTVRRTFAMAGLALGSIEACAPYATSRQWSAALMVLSLTGLGLASANCWALTQTLVSGPIIGRVIGLQNLTANLAGILSPLITGWLKQVTSAYTAALWMVAIVLISGMLSFYLLVRTKTTLTVPRVTRKEPMTGRRS